tara:strand:- start:292 stop:594 length:303 start_codon:yes stop_codon:yes gene_type:complete
MTTEEEYKVQFDEAVQYLKPAILEASEIYTTDVLVSAMIEVGMRLSLLKYGTIGMIGLLADILHTTATSGVMIEEMNKSKNKSDSDVMNAFNNASEDTKH